MTSQTGFRPSPAHFALTLSVLMLGVVPLPHALSEWIGRRANTLADLPGTEVPFKLSRRLRDLGAVVVIARHSQPRRDIGPAHAQQGCGLGNLFVETQGAGVAREEQTIVSTAAQVVIRIGRRRVGPAVRTARFREYPLARSAFV